MLRKDALNFLAIMAVGRQAHRQTKTDCYVYADALKETKDHLS